MPLNAETNLAQLAALMQLASPALPVGAFSYSQGLESAVEARVIHDAPTAQRWIFDHAELVIARYELPVWLRLYSAWDDEDLPAIARWNEEFIASRETREFRGESMQMGYSLFVWLRELGLATPPQFKCAWPTAHARACVALGVDRNSGAAAYLYSSIENQVAAAIKAVPIGHVAGQRILLASHGLVARCVAEAQTRDDNALETSAPMLAWHSARHETQYSRLFRS